MSIYHGYEPARSCTGSATPGCQALMAWFLGAYKHLGAVNLGIYNCRKITGGQGYSLHAEGRACDLGIRPHSAAWGSTLAAQLWNNSAELGIQLIIWNRRYASGSKPDRGWMPYTGQVPHVDHIHAELSWHAARTLTVKHIQHTMGRASHDLAGSSPETVHMATRLEAAITAAGILPERAGVVVAEAKRAGLPLAVGCVMLMKESGGGRNVYGHDKVKCGPVGGAVTKENYREYLKNRARCGMQGVGPTQLTYYTLQDRADRAGGCWRPEVNIRVGFEILAGYVRAGSVRDAFSRYNTGKPGDSPYARDAMKRLPRWQKVIADASKPADDLTEEPQGQIAEL